MTRFRSRMDMIWVVLFLIFAPILVISIGEDVI